MAGQIRELIIKCHDYAVRKGFWESKNPHDISGALATMALIHSEISEGVEAIRTEGFGNLEEELADTVIRVFDFAGALGYDLEQAIVDKMAMNEKREHKHGKMA